MSICVESKFPFKTFEITSQLFWLSACMQARIFHTNKQIYFTCIDVHVDMYNFVCEQFFSYMCSRNLKNYIYINENLYPTWQKTKKKNLNNNNIRKIFSEKHSTDFHTSYTYKPENLLCLKIRCNKNNTKKTTKEKFKA